MSHEPGPTTSTRGARLLSLWILAGLATLGAAASATAQEVCDVQRLSPPGALSSFGQSTDQVGDLLVVADPQRPVGTLIWVGAVHIYRREAGIWVHEATMGSGDPAWFQRFGIQARTDGQRVFGACRSHSPLLSPVEASIAVLERINGTWTLTDRVSDPLNQSNQTNTFGHDFEVEDGRLFVAHEEGFLEFEETPAGWVVAQRFELATDLPPWITALLPPGPTVVWSLEVDSVRGTLLMTVPGALIACARVGSDWVPVQHFPFPVSSSNEFQLAQDGDWAAVGLNLQSPEGRVHLFEFDGSAWAPAQSVTSPTPDVLSTFGSDLDLRGEWLLVGRPLEPLGSATCGRVEVFQLQQPQGTWQHVGTELPSDPIDYRHYGSSLRIGSHHEALITGATQQGIVDDLPGVVDVVRLEASLGTPLADAAPNSSGLPARLRARGSAERDHDCLRLEVDRLPANRFGYFVLSSTQAFPTPLPGGQGSLDLGQPLVRLADTPGYSGNVGRVQQEVSLFGLPTGPAPAPGETWTFQYWTRDANPAPTSNTSNALAITFENHGPPVVQFPASVRVEVEHTGQLDVPVTLDRPLPHDLSVPFTVSGTATHLVDWRVELASPLVIPAGETEVLVPVILADDTLQEGAEFATITLGPPSVGAELGTQPTWTLRIDDDD